MRPLQMHLCVTADCRESDRPGWRGGARWFYLRLALLKLMTDFTDQAAL